MNQRSWWVTGLQFLGLGWYIAVAIVVGTLGGLGLDNWAGTSPMLLILGLLLGVSVAFYGTYRMSAMFVSDQRASEKDKEL